MKKALLLTAFIAALFYQPVAAQDSIATIKDNSIYIGVGFGILPDIQVFYGNKGLFWSWHTYENKQVSGFTSLQFQYTAFEKMSVTLFGGLESEYGTMNYNPYANDKPENWETIGGVANFSRTVYKYGVEMSGNYITTHYSANSWCSVYGTLGAAWYNIVETDSYLPGMLTKGPADSIVKNNMSSHSFYVSPLGVRFGGNRLSAYIEVGLGYKGMLNGGIMYCLNRRRNVVTK